MVRPLPWQRSDCGLRARVPKDVHTINIIRLTRDRRVKDAGEDAVMRVGAGGTRLRGGRGLRLLSLVSDCYALVSIYNLWKWNLLLPFWRTLFRTARSSQFAASTHNSQSTCCLADSQLQPPCQFPPQPSLIWPTAASCFILQLIIMPINQRYNAYKPQPQTGKIKRRPTTMMKSCLKCLLLCGGTSSTRMVRELHWHYDYKYDYDYDNGCGYLPINNDGVRRRLVAVTTALLITAAAAGKLKLRGNQLVSL